MSGFESPSTPSRGRLRRLGVRLFKLVWWLGVLTLAGLIVLLWMDSDLPSGFEPPFIVEEGDVFRTVDESMAAQSWPVKKSPDDYRVFLFGGSQAFGSPYVHRDLNHSSRLLTFLKIPNRGGIATWLEAYLGHLLPDRKVQVVNLAVPGAPITAARQLLPEVLAHGEPDLLLVLSGNNQGSIWDPEALLLGEAFDGYLREVEGEYRGHLEEMTALVREPSVPLWLLTVPANLRDHLPTDRSEIPLEPTLAAANAGDCDAVAASTRTPEEDDSLAMYLRGRCLDRSGHPAEALPFYERALQRDKVFQRARPSFNAILRSLEGEQIRVVDLEQRMRARARDGIPGDDLFIDSCHMRLAGYRLMGLELASEIGEVLGVDPARIAELPALPVEVLTRSQMERLYTIKRLKWLRLRLLSATGSIEALNRGRFAENFARADNDFGDFTYAIDRMEKDLPAVEEVIDEARRVRERTAPE